MAREPAIFAERLGKVFRVPLDRRSSLKQHAVNLFRSGRYTTFEALKDINLSIQPGEFFGVIGQNGSGKSTLLKILAGIYTPSRGRVHVNGRLSPFIELGVGFNPELTARDNVYLNGAILGLTRNEVVAQFDDIIAFAELEQFVEQKLKNFSSGMLVRLAFSVAIRAHADVLLIDEVLAVGDANFQQKCYDVFRRLKAEQRTIVFVSHDLASIKEFSDRVLVLDRGLQLGIFSPANAIARYSELNEQRTHERLTREAGEGGVRHTASGRPSIRSVNMVAADGGPVHVIQRGESTCIVMAIDNQQRVPFNAGVAVYRNDGLYCFGTNTFVESVGIPTEPELEIKVEIPHLPLQRGTYYLVAGLYGDSPRTVFDLDEHAFDFHVAQRDDYEGVLFIDHRWHVDAGVKKTVPDRKRKPASGAKA